MTEIKYEKKSSWVRKLLGVGAPPPQPPGQTCVINDMTKKYVFTTLSEGDNDKNIIIMMYRGILHFT
jgi:hypothetical protein